MKKSLPIFNTRAPIVSGSGLDRMQVDLTLRDAARQSQVRIEQLHVRLHALSTANLFKQ